MRLFKRREVKEALAHAEAGGQALHLHRMLTPGAPRCFVAAVKRGEPIGHLFDKDVERLRATARRLGVKVVKVGREGKHGQHVDLCGGPLERAFVECENLFD